ILGLGQIAQAQQPEFYNGEIVTIEDGIEAHRVYPVATSDNKVIEVRVSECEGCLFDTYIPAKAIEFFVGEKAVEVAVATKVSSKYSAVVLIDHVTRKVNSVYYNSRVVGGEM
ncbi:MAG: hypothetical protein ACTHWH_13790, partial [Marinobacter sp.]